MESATENIPPRAAGLDARKGGNVTQEEQVRKHLL